MAKITTSDNLNLTSAKHCVMGITHWNQHGIPFTPCISLLRRSPLMKIKHYRANGMQEWMRNWAPKQSVIICLQGASLCQRKYWNMSTLAGTSIPTLSKSNKSYGQMVFSIVGNELIIYHIISCADRLFICETYKRIRYTTEALFSHGILVWYSGKYILQKVQTLFANWLYYNRSCIHLATRII